jgi:hypothetical protein
VNTGSDGARVQTFSTTRALLENVEKVSASTTAMQAALDSKQRILLNNYPVTALRVLDAGQQVNLVALAVTDRGGRETTYFFHYERPIARSGAWNHVER